MPILPPRNLPFSPPGASSAAAGHSAAALPQTPNSAKTERTSHSSPAAASSSTTPSKTTRDADKTAGDGILPRQEETTYHRKLRSILWDFRKAYEKWIDLVSSQGAKAIATTAKLCASLDDLLGKESKESGKARLPWRMAERMDAFVDTIRDFDEAKEELNEIMVRIGKASIKFSAISDAAENLLVEATENRGSDFTFEREMWLTWSMDDLVTTVQQIASQCTVQTAHLQLLSRLLTENCCAPGEPPHPSAPSQQISVDENVDSDQDDERTAEDSEEEEREERDTGKGDNYDGKRKRKGRGRLRERILEEWQRLAILYDEACPVDPDMFEDICEVEVGRWEER